MTKTEFRKIVNGAIDKVTTDFLKLPTSKRVKYFPEKEMFKEIVKRLKKACVSLKKSPYRVTLPKHDFDSEVVMVLDSSEKAVLKKLQKAFDDERTQVDPQKGRMAEIFIEWLSKEGHAEEMKIRKIGFIDTKMRRY